MMLSYKWVRLWELFGESLDKVLGFIGMIAEAVWGCAGCLTAQVLKSKGPHIKIILVTYSWGGIVGWTLT